MNIFPPGLEEPEWFQFHFDPSITLIPGEEYFISVKEITYDYNIHWYYYEPDIYSGGTAWWATADWTFKQQPDKDFAFETEYYEAPPGCVRKGGHYVTCAGVNSDMFKIAISDPYWDINNPSLNDHNDAQYVSHDIYKVSLGSPCPKLLYQWWLPEYPSEHDYTIVEQAVVICPKDATPPVISDVALTPSDPIDTGGWENVTCNVTDNVLVNHVNLVVTHPNATTVEYAMANILGTDTYYYNTTFTQSGNYSYHIWADDLSGNSVTSTPKLFAIPTNYDVDGDGRTYSNDLMCVIWTYGDTGPGYPDPSSFGWIREDIDNNGRVYSNDLMNVIWHYGEWWWT